MMLGACALLLSACGEIDQSKTAGNTYRNDVPASQGAKNAHVVSGWQPGNQGSWENQIRARGQLQNEYQKVN
ncbi:hypothetical protein NCCP691_20730 [Noviherbaspirillum aridicola]|uniref:Lipoprotein n=2 Tax=Noviherbaspirillum aridicola TaxID=2849687 RepID=A0ABQ4Q4M0_9BURK|nr:hypothetical protein NCCP691_20730 [Noviherbaspirillum aridicola]